MSVTALIIGLSAGILSGLIGIGGGILMIPALSIFMGYDQHMAQGTTLAAMVLPIGLLAAWEYHSHGYVNVPVALTIAAAFFFGGFFGAKLAAHISSLTLQRFFGVIMLVIAIQMIMGK